jgi:hypothetical protein
LLRDQALKVAQRNTNFEEGAPAGSTDAAVKIDEISARPPWQLRIERYTTFARIGNRPGMPAFDLSHSLEQIPTFVQQM